MRPVADDGNFLRLDEGAHVAVQEARRAYAGTGKRPIAPARRDRAFIQLLIELERIVDIIERPFNENRSATHPALPEGGQPRSPPGRALRRRAGRGEGGAR